MFSWCGNNSKTASSSSRIQTQKSQEKESTKFSNSTYTSSPKFGKSQSIVKVEYDPNSFSLSSRTRFDLDEVNLKPQKDQSVLKSESKCDYNGAKLDRTENSFPGVCLGEKGQKSFEEKPFSYRKVAGDLARDLRGPLADSERLEKFRDALQMINEMISEKTSQCLISSEWFYECFVNFYNGKVVSMPMNNWGLLEKLLKNKINKTDYEVVSYPMFFFFELFYGGGPIIEIPPKEETFFYLTHAFKEEIIKETNMTYENFSMQELKPRYCSLVKKWEIQSLKISDAETEKTAPKSHRSEEKKDFLIKEDIAKLKEKEKKNISDFQQQKSKVYHETYLSVCPKEKESQMPIRGIENPSNFCYLNSILQALISTPGFVPSVLASQSTYSYVISSIRLNGKPQERSSILESFALFFKDYIKSNSSAPLENTPIRRMLPEDMKNGQQDAHECLTILLGSLQDDLTKMNGVSRQGKFEFKTEDDADNYLSMFNFCFVDRLFLGRFNAEYKCRSCKHISYNFDPFYGISLGAGSSSVGSLVKHYFKSEGVPFSCEECKKSTKATKTLKIARLPKVLVLHIKRFVYKPEMQKINKEISFPKSLDLKKYSQFSLGP